MTAFVKTPEQTAPHASRLITMSNPTQMEVMQLRQLAEMLTFKRPGGSKTERDFITQYLAVLKGYTEDEMGNGFVRIGDKPTVLWSSHTDTVHYTEGYQRVVYRPTTQVLALSADSSSSCLGADCTTGVWLMREMILAGVPGLYVFHAFEETGGRGSDHIARKTPKVLDGIQCAVAFDRRASFEVITHQMGERCASDKFANSLAALLPGQYRPSDGGSFTDTANYRDIVPECVNIGVGYDRAHTSDETQCVPTALALLRSLTALTYDHLSTLVIARDPTPVYDKWADWDSHYANANDPYAGDIDDPYAELDEMINLVYEHPDDVAHLLQQMGYSLRDVEDYLGVQRSRRKVKRYC